MLKTIAIVDSAIQSPVLECFNKLSEWLNTPAQYHLPALFGVESLERILKADAIFLLGSASSVNDSLEWQKHLQEVVQKATEREIPVLGICFGHQFLAHLFGGRVGYIREDKDKLLGTRVIEFQEKFGDIKQGQSLELAITHREHVKTLPDGFRVLGKSDTQSFDAIRHSEKCIVGIQAHPEASRHFAINIIKDFNLENYDQIRSNGELFLSSFLKEAGLK